MKYKKDTDFRLPGEYINRLSGEKEFFIRKAIGWSLREYSKTDPGTVRAFVAKLDISDLSKKEALKWLNNQNRAKQS